MPHRTAAGPARPRLLLVEDNPLNRLVLGQIIEHLGMDYSESGCVAEAMRRFARESFDAVLLDVRMDGMAGLGAARMMRDFCADETLPILALGPGDVPMETLSGAGFDAAIDLPLDGSALTEALIGVLDRALEASAG